MLENATEYLSVLQYEPVVYYSLARSLIEIPKRSYNLTWLTLMVFGLP